MTQHQLIVYQCRLFGGDTPTEIARQFQYFGGKQPYLLASLEVRLDRAFGRYAGDARNKHNGIPQRLSYEQLRGAFIKYLKRAIKQNLPASGNVDVSSLNRMERAAQGDWSDINVIKAVYDMYHQIKGTKYDEKMLFPQIQ